MGEILSAAAVAELRADAEEATGSNAWKFVDYELPALFASHEALRAAHAAALADRDRVLAERNVAIRQAHTARAERDAAVGALEGHGSLAALLDDINAWALQQFPDATNASVVAHLREEVTELEEAPGSGEECADIIMLATSWSKRCGNDIYADLAAKLTKNRARSWAHRDAGDYRKHVAATPDA